MRVKNSICIGKYAVEGETVIYFTITQDVYPGNYPPEKRNPTGMWAEAPANIINISGTGLILLRLTFTLARSIKLVL